MGGYVLWLCGLETSSLSLSPDDVLHCPLNTSWFIPNKSCSRLLSLTFSKRSNSLEQHCLFSTDVGGIPLNEPLPGVAVRRPYDIVQNSSYETSVTTLENGLKVATENSFGQFSTVGGKKDFFFI